MAFPASTPKLTSMNATSTAAKAPATAQASRQVLKIVVPASAANEIYYGDSTVTTSLGVAVQPGGESDWIPCSDNIYVIAAASTAIIVLEMA